MAFEEKTWPCYEVDEEFAQLAARAEYLQNLQKFASKGEHTNWGRSVLEQRNRFRDVNDQSRDSYWGFGRGKPFVRSDDVKCRIPVGMIDLMLLFHQSIEFEIDEAKKLQARRLSHADDPDPLSGYYEPPQG